MRSLKGPCADSLPSPAIRISVSLKYLLHWENPRVSIMQHLTTAVCFIVLIALSSSFPVTNSDPDDLDRTERSASFEGFRGYGGYYPYGGQTNTASLALLPLLLNRLSPAPSPAAATALAALFALGK
ncbi:hypothetical protein MATL_G00222340 [Megalops atlanticus]|uniref:Uncharacterized protein n=1 Tax=Megalops atlanticus TaxID=7932 RepID=A0A9D3SWC1_MEGAT|nr:hypothetical protein MATL_G00222340 [Megalops atlanticus]